MQWTNLLNEPVLSVRSDNTQALNLPATLAALGHTDVSFPALRVHQQHAWHAFLVQLAAIALHRADLAEPAQDEDTWRDLLLALTDDNEAPWTLVVPELSKPAFLQPPVPEKTLKGYKDTFVSPEQLDVPVTSKNHDLKGCLMRAPTPELWIFGLVSLQTTQGFSGRQSYGIARMNGGYGSRPCVTLAPGDGLDDGARFRRDVGVLLDKRSALLQTHRHFAHKGGAALLWLLPWDGSDSLPLSTCDPYFIEICRRVRLVADGDRMLARYVSTKAPRLAAKELNGVTGDPWTPINLGKEASLSVSLRGFDYDLSQQLALSNEWRRGLTQDPTPSERGQPMTWLATAMARGQGKTDKLHRRLLPIPKRAWSLFVDDDQRQRLAELAKERVEDAATLRRKVLHPALCALFQAGPAKLDLRDDRPQRFNDRFTDQVDEHFFEELWTDANPELEAHEVRKRWRQTLKNLGEHVLEHAITYAPIPQARQYRAVAAAEGMYRGALRKNFPELFATPDQTTAERSPS